MPPSIIAESPYRPASAVRIRRLHRRLSLDDYDRAYIGTPDANHPRARGVHSCRHDCRHGRAPELQSIALDSNSKMQFTNYDEEARTRKIH